MKAKKPTPMIDLGITQEELREQVIERATAALVERVDNGDYSRSRMNQAVTRATDEAVKQYATETVLPLVKAQLETIIFQATNTWGEKTGKALTFREYLVDRAERWLTEQVDYEGKAKGENSFGSFKASQTRVAHMVHQHLHYNIEKAMKEALASANSQIVQGIQKTVEIKLAEISAAMRVEVKTR